MAMRMSDVADGDLSGIQAFFICVIYAAPCFELARVTPQTIKV